VVFSGCAYRAPEWKSRDVGFGEDDQVCVVGVGFVDEGDCFLDCFGGGEEDWGGVAGCCAEEFCGGHCCGEMGN
jgi:hypothetical protein